VEITAAAVSLNVDDVPASSAFLIEHFGFRERMATDGFASLVWWLVGAVDGTLGEPCRTKRPADDRAELSAHRLLPYVYS
jgi:hypothetical protein